jgi:integrase
VNRLVVIRRSMPDGTDTAAPTKSGTERRIPLTDTLAAALKSIRGLRHLQGGLVFGRRRDGGVLSLYAVRERLERACRKAGLRRIRWHDMRHSFASQLISAGMPIRQVQEWLGHSTITMTMRYAPRARNR